jgi:hypothetical protein
METSGDNAEPLPETLPSAPEAPPDPKSEPVPIATSNGAIMPETPASEPIAAAVGQPGGIIAAQGQCPVCGKSGLQNVQAHVRAAHGDPSWRKKGTAASVAKARGGVKPVKAPAVPGENGSGTIPLTAPDFSDITGEPASGPELAPSDVKVSSPRFEAMATMTFDMSTGLMARIFGPEWLPNDKEPMERATVVMAIKKYYESIDLPDMPPGMMLCFVIAMYSAPRLAAHPTRTKLQGAWLWLKSKFSRRQKQPPLKVIP